MIFEFGKPIQLCQSKFSSGYIFWNQMVLALTWSALCVAERLFMCQENEIVDSHVTWQCSFPKPVLDWLIKNGLTTVLRMPVWVRFCMK